MTSKLRRQGSYAWTLLITERIETNNIDFKCFYQENCLCTFEKEKNRLNVLCQNVAIRADREFLYLHPIMTEP